MKISSLGAFVATLFLLNGCSSTPTTPPPNPFAAVQTIELRDATDPVLLAASGAKRVTELVEIGLSNRGYKVSRQGPADVIASVKVHTYTTRQTSKRDWLGWGNLNYVVEAESEWTISISRNGETIFEMERDHDDTTPIETLVVQQVQDVVRRIPICTKAQN